MMQAEDTVQSRRVSYRLVATVVLAALAVLGFFVYPGHTFLESDSQIFMPALLHRMNPALFGQDILIKSVHTTYTIWDELAVGIQRVTGLGIEPVLFGLQIVLRFVGLLGVFWLLEALLLGSGGANGAVRGPPANRDTSRWLALAGTAVYGLGSFVTGPTLLMIEYEPVPRAFSLPFVLLGLGLIARGRFVAAGIAGACAYLMHPPTSLAFWGVYFLAALVHTEDAKRWHGLALLPAAAAVLQFFAWIEPLAIEPQAFFTRIDPDWERLQRFRAPYIFPSDWLGPVYWVDACLVAMIVIAYLRLRPTVEARLRTFVWGLPAVGVVSIPLTWLLLEKLKWSLMPQLQPMRYTLYLVLFAIVLGYAAGITQAIRHARYAEAGIWFMAALSVGFQNLNLLWLVPLLLGASLAGRRKEWIGIAAGAPFAAVLIWRKPFGFAAWTQPNLKVVGVAAGLSVLLLLLVLASRRLFSLVPAAAAAVAVVLLFAASTVGRPASSNVSTPALRELSAWAQSATQQNAVFQFADAGRSLEPGVFRYYARRTVFVDWKGGGQVNYFRAFGDEWWQRWEAVAASRYSPARVETYRKQGIGYLVFKKLPARAPGPVVFRNASYAVVLLAAQ